MSDQVIEQEIQDKGLTAPRVTFDQVEVLMKQVTYHCHVVPGTTTTVCTAIDPDGFTLATGMSACASPENFDESLGEKIAKQNAERYATEELWKLEGYALKKRLVGTARTEGKTGFQRYQSKPVQRLAHEVQRGQVIEKIGEATFITNIEGETIQFKAYEPVQAGDYIVYLNDSDVYHCSRAVFHERNIV